MDHALENRKRDMSISIDALGPRFFMDKAARPSISESPNHDLHRTRLFLLLTTMSTRFFANCQIPSARIKTAKDLALMGLMRGNDFLDIIEENMQRAKGIDDPQFRFGSLIRIAKILIEFDAERQVMTALEYARDANKEVEDPLHRAVGKIEIAELLLNIGKKSDALKLIGEAVPSIRKIENSRMKLLYSLFHAQNLLKIGEKKMAVNLMDIALAAANNMDRGFDKTKGAINIFQAYLSVGKADKASIAAKEIDDSLFRDMALRKVADLFEKMGKKVKAKKVLESIFPASAADRPDSLFSFEETVALLYEMGEVEEALRRVRDHEGTLHSEMLNPGIFRAFVKGGELEKALFLAARMNDLCLRTLTFINIAQTLLMLGRHEKIDGVVGLAMVSAADIDKPDKKAELQAKAIKVYLGSAYKMRSLDNFDLYASFASEIKHPVLRFAVQSNLIEFLVDMGKIEKASKIAIEAISTEERIISPDWKLMLSQDPATQTLLKESRTQEAVEIIERGFDAVVDFPLPRADLSFSRVDIINEVAKRLAVSDPQVLSRDRVAAFLDKFKVADYSQERAFEYKILTNILSIFFPELVDQVIASDLAINVEELRDFNNFKFYRDLTNSLPLPRSKALVEIVEVNREKIIFEEESARSDFWASLAVEYLRKKEKYAERQAKMSELRLRDAHVHTNWSSGEHSLRDVLIHAMNEGVATLVPTDHNTIKGLFKSLELAREYDLDITFGGVELRCFYGGREIHVKVYFDPRALRIIPVIKLVQKSLQDISRKQLQEMRGVSTREGLLKLLREGNLDPAEVFEGMRRSPFIDNATSDAEIMDVLLRFFGKVRELPDGQLSKIIEDTAIKHISESFLSLGVLAARDREYNIFRDFITHSLLPHLKAAQELEIEQILKRVKEAGGWASIAHPEFTGKKGLGQEQMDRMIADLAKKGLVKSIEVMYPFHGQETTDHYSELADRLGLDKDGGTDFHDIADEQRAGRIGRGMRENGRYNVDVSFGFFERVRDFLAKPYLEKGDRHLGERDLITALLNYNVAVSLAPYKLEVYDLMIECVRGIAGELWMDLLLDRGLSATDRIGVARQLAVFPREAIVPKYIKVLDESHAPDLQREVAKILGRIKDSRTVPVLEKVAKNAELNYLPDVVEEAERSLDLIKK